LLELERVVKYYRSASEDVRAVDGVSLAMSPGEMVALYGPSGSGKTTLLLLVAALMKPDAGSILYAGRDLTGLSENQASEYLLRDVGFIFQGFHLMPRVSAVDNAARKLILQNIGIRKAREQAIPWLERVGLADRLHHTPEKLSGGERQRVAIARALSCEPGLILADEPTGNLDSARSRDIIELLSDIAHERNAAVLLVTHDQEAAVIADHSYTLRDGRLTLEEKPQSNRPDRTREQAPRDGARAPSQAS
jgi:putative ABC transport system ATP-binding protein